MKKYLLISSFLVALVLAFSSFFSIVSLPSSYITCFSPSQQCGDMIVNHIHKAKQSIFIQAYGFTSKKIIAALIEARKKGVKIAIILDRSNFHKKNKNTLDILTNAGIEISEDRIKGIAHNKVMIIDDNIVITGSFNFTENADKRNAENIIIITNDDIAKAYYQNWLVRR